MTQTSNDNDETPSEIDRLRAFAREIIRGAWEGSDADGGDVQELAAKLGLIEKVPFDPKIHHGEDAEWCKPGDDWYVFSEILREKK